MNSWVTQKLGDLIVLHYGKSLKTENRIEGLIPVFSSAGVTGYHNEALVEGPGIIVGRKGSVGTVYLSQDSFYCIDTAYYIKPNNEKYDFLYLFYLLKTLGLTELNEDSAVPGLNRQTAYDQIVNIPPLPEQQAIASVLSALDDKIDLLQRQNQTLEQMAATLFRQWFIEEAKEEWEEVTIGDLCAIVTKGTTPKSFTTLGVNFIKAESLSGNGAFIKNKFAYISEEVHFNSLKRSVLQKGDLLFSIAGTIGRVAIVTEDILPANTNQALAILRPREINYSNFIYCILKSSLFQGMVDSKVVHAVQPNLSLGEISNSSLRLPKKLVLNQFVDLIEPFFIKIRFNIQQLETLQSLRDTLLPKLISGEVRLKGFETVS